MFIAKKVLTVTQRHAYSFAFSQATNAKTFLEKHQIAMDAVMAHDLAVPGLDLFVIKPTNMNAAFWNGAGRIRKFENAMSQGVTLRPHWYPQLTSQKLGASEAIEAFGVFSRSSTASDAALAKSLAVPGLDAYVLKTSTVAMPNWRGAFRSQKFAQALRQGITLQPERSSIAVPTMRFVATR